MGQLHTGHKTSIESYFNLHVIPQATNQKERANTGTWHSLSRLTPGGSSDHLFEGNSIIIPWAGEAFQPWLAIR